MRKATSGTGPKWGVETRMKRKEAPQIAASERRIKISASRTRGKSFAEAGMSRGSFWEEL